MKIVHLTSVHPRFDTRIFQKQCVSLSVAGYFVTLIVADGLGGETASGVDILDVGLAKGRLKRVFLTGFKILKASKSVDGDLYQIHDPELIFVGLLLRASGKKVIFDSHEDVPKQILDKPYFSRRIAYLVSRLYMGVERLLIPFFSGVITATSTIRTKFLGISRNVVDINNYPIIRSFGDSCSPFSSEDLAVCYVGAIAETRGIIEIVDSLALCKFDVRLLLGGKFTDEDLEGRVRASAGWEKVRFLGYLDRVEVNSVLSRSLAGLVTLHPTASYIEALPVKMFEYMNSGIPVISSNIKLWSDIVDAERCGICVNPKDPKAIAQAIDYLAGNSLEAQRMGERGKLAIDEKYNWSREEEKLLKFYDSLLSD